MPQEENKLSSEPHARLAVLGKQVERVRDRVAMLSKGSQRVRVRAARDEENMDAIECELGNLLDDLQGMVRGSGVVPLAGKTKAPRRVGVTRGPRWPSRGPSHAVGSAELIAQPNGSATAQIDGTDIGLPPYVAAILDILMGDNGGHPDNLLPWNSVATIQALLTKRTKRNHSKAAVKEMVLRLRNLLEKRGLDRWFVETNPQLGYRVALRRKAGTVKCDNL
jgi:hypothetical protein